MANNSSNLSIEDLISMIYLDIESKKKIISSLKKEYNQSSSPTREITININAFTFFDLIDEFDITISQSLQAIQTLQTEMWNLKEKIEMIQLEKLKTNGFCYVKGNNEMTTEKIAGIEFDNDINEEPVVESIRKDLISHKYTIEETKEYKTIKDESNQISNYRIKTPIRTSLRQSIKTSNKDSVHDNDEDNKGEKVSSNLISKISTVDSYRMYFAKKYGNGSYDMFIHKLNNKELKKKSLEDELNLIEDIISNQFKGKKEKNSSVCSNDDNKTNDIKQNIKGQKTIHHSNSTKRHTINNKFNTIPINTQNNNTKYVAPIDFSINSFLRNTHNGNKSKRHLTQKSSSKENKDEKYK